MKKNKQTYKNIGYYLILLYGRLIPKTLKWDKKYLKLKYRYLMKKNINIEKPETFNEKLQYLKLYNRKDLYTTMVDKYEAKQYVSNIIGEKYIIPTIEVYDNFNEIDFDRLPNQFVIKCTHDSGGLVLVKDKSKLNIKTARKKISKSLKRNYYYSGREWPYKNVKPQIIVEEYLTTESGHELNDYKFWCFDGKPELCLVCSERQTNLKETFFDMNWSLLDIKRPNHSIDETIKKPVNFDLMKKLAEELSQNIPFVRVDFYEVKGKVYFGELTFYPAGGFSKFEPEQWDKRLGDLINL